MADFVTRSGAMVPDHERVLISFFEEEWAYYDGIEDPEPDRITPVDVLATNAVNSYLGSAGKIRSVHRGLAAVLDPVLNSVPVGADLRTFDEDVVIDLLDRACQVKWVLVATAAKVLHRKRRSLIPMLDSVVIGHYLTTMERQDLIARTQDKRVAGETARVPLEGFRDDLNAAWDHLTALRSMLDERDYPVSQLRILEVLVWMAADPRQQYVGSADRG